MTALLVALGAAVGAPARHLVDQWMRRRFGDRFPWGTLTVNVAGSLLLGLLAGLPADPRITALAGTGFCGALTTYSTFSWDIRSLSRTSRLRSLAYALTSVTAGLTAAALGLFLTS